MKIVVMGYIIRGPLGGMAWHHFQYVLGLVELGHDVLYIEDSDDYPSCYHPENFTTTTEASYGLHFIDNLFRQFDLKDAWAYYDSHLETWHNIPKEKALVFCSSADVLLNLSGINPIREWFLKVPCRLLIDTDPGFFQVRMLQDITVLEMARAHTHFFSFAENIGQEACKLPTVNLPWHSTRQPVFLPAWKVSGPQPNGPWTTIMQWDSYKEASYNGSVYGMKSKAFKDYENLPGRLTDETFEIAMGSDSAPRTQLVNLGWKITDPFKATATPWVFQKYIATSKGEWTIAKHGYVETHSGWFSERTLNYMASAKPVVVQDTGFTSYLPSGKGVFAFSNLEEAIEAIKIVNADYEFHCLQARKVVEEYFDSSKILQNLLNKL